jgi:hypothetical protein
MKLPLTIALTIAFLTSQAQTDSDTLKVAAPDSLAGLVLPDSIMWVALDSALFRLTPAQELYITSIPSLDPVGLYTYIPSCKELEARKGNW